MKYFRDLFSIAAVVTALFVARPTHASLIVGGSPTIPGGFNIGNISGGYIDAGVAFTMPGQSYLLTDVLLGLLSYDGPGEIQVRLYEYGGAGFLPELIDPPSLPGVTEYVFTPSSPITLLANTSYALTVVATTDEGYPLYWQYAGGYSGVGTVTDHLISYDHGPFGIDTFIPYPLRFEINGTLIAPASTGVPETGSTLILLLVTMTAMTLYLADLKRRQRLQAIRATIRKSSSKR